MEAVILVGLQASGKTTFCRERFFHTHLRLSMDMLRTRHREEILLGACLEAKQPFVVDNTNPTRQERARYIERARAARFRVCGLYFESKIADCKRRNSGREAAFVIPEVGLLGTYARLEVPSREEGFDDLRYVCIGDDGAFDVREWTDAL